MFPLRALSHLLLLLSLTVSTAAHAVEPVDAGNGQHAIVGGAPEQTPYPWIAALVRRGTGTVTSRQFCGGVLIDPHWVLTAAHCVRGATPSSYQVLVGELNLEVNNPSMHDVSEQVRHPFYEDGGNNFDIALVRLATPSANRVISLPDAAAEQLARVSSFIKALGWGNSAWNDQAICTMEFLDQVAHTQDFGCKSFVFRPGTDTSTLRVGTIALKSYAECDARYREIRDSQMLPQDDAPEFSDSATPDMLCGWSHDASTTPCFGDSGGPLFGNFAQVDYVFGVISHGVRGGCPTAHQIGIYARVAYLRPFITYTLGRARELGHGQLCPGSLAPVIAYTPRPDGRQDARLSWDKDSVAEGDRVLYSPQQSLGGNIQSLELGSGADHVSVALNSGQKFIVAVQARSARCDGPLSPLVTVNVP